MTAAEVRSICRGWRCSGQRIALVPTMGNLHEGHAALIRQAVELADRVVVSNFVNPTQFGPAEDLDRYPRTPEHDAQMCARLDVDLVFAPTVSEMYPAGLSETPRVEIPGLSAILCGASRPGHFSGVATVVAKLLNIVEPDYAVFGEKDFQQLVVIKRLVEALCFAVVIVGVPIWREPDGLAMSSRNQYLSAAERKRAPELYRTLGELAQTVAGGERDFAALEAAALDRLRGLGFEPDYVSVRDAGNLTAPRAETRDLVVLAAARLGKARLIDNIHI